MIRKVSIDGVGYSVVELNDHRHVFAAAIPRSGTTLREQTEDALRTIQAVMEEEGTRGAIVQQAVFVKDFDRLDECREIIRRFYGKNAMPATSYIAQPPCDGKLVSIEALGVGNDTGGVKIERHSERMVVTRHDGISWFHCADIQPDTISNGTYDRSTDAFMRMMRRLADRGVPYGNVIRTWLYLGDIVGPEGDTQRYKELNRARADFYQGFRFGAGLTPSSLNGSVYPASTGIGTDGRDILMSCIGLTTDRSDVVVTPLENPQQTSAFDYREQYSPESPKFARAMAIAMGEWATVFISGTASITGSETRFIGDVEGQTRQTLENIAALVTAENFTSHDLPGFASTLEDLALVRVYIKHQEDYLKTRKVCEAMLGELPSIYAVGDVCRPDLLVEIEGIVFSHRAT